MEYRFSDMRPEICGVMTIAIPGEPVDVSHLASFKGLDARVVFAPEVWAACDPEEKGPDLFRTMAARDQKAAAILKAMERKMREYGGGTLIVRTLARGKRLTLQVDVLDVEADPYYFVRVA